MNSELMGPKLVNDIVSLIESTKTNTAKVINSSLVLMYWKIGKKITEEIPNELRAEYGEKIIKQLAQQLRARYGRGFNRSSLFRMVQFYKQFPNQETVATLSRQLSWSHFVELISFDDALKQKFYTEMCRIENWSVRELRKKVDGMLYERTAISKQPEKIIEQDLNVLQENNQFSSNLVFRDPYILDFLELPNNYSEKSLENAIIDELSTFLQEMGTDFSFISRQKRITIDNEDYYIDLLTYHRGLSRLVAIEIKLGRFTAAHKGQVELYLKWLNKYERRPGENEPLGLILCADKKDEHIELLELDKSGIHVAQYLTDLPDKKILEQKLRLAIDNAKEKHARIKQQKANFDESDNE